MLPIPVIILITVGTICILLTLATLIAYIWDTLEKKVNHPELTLKEASEETFEQVKAQNELNEKYKTVRLNQSKIANIRELDMYFQTTIDYILGEMEVCYKIDDMPTYLKPFKCQMERHIWNREEEDEIQGILIFARKVEDVIDYMNCFFTLDPDASGFTFHNVNYIYDGGLRESTDLQRDIRYSQHAFVIDRCTGYDYKNKNN